MTSCLKVQDQLEECFFLFTWLSLFQITNLFDMDSICALKGRHLGLKPGIDEVAQFTKAVAQ